MSTNLQQLDNTAKRADRKAGVEVRSVPLNASSALLVLVLVIIPTFSGVTLIA